MFNYKTNKWEMLKDGKIISTFDRNVIEASRNIKFVIDDKNTVVRFDLKDCGMV
jgi:hypothetical protein